ncbi:MAG: DeoR/GlpR transcriptional regulator [Clostridiales bacterium]|nr:DeoR/GlpR transcriptional regulator [Clostridiales bacterium]
MSYKKRSIQIIDYLKEHKTASVEQLAHILYVSEATIRRDLTEMQKLGQIERSHGGAILSENSDELSIFIRQTKNAKEKMKAVSIALKNIPDFQTVFIDNSSTCLALVERMNFSRKTVVTNGLQVAMRISKYDGVTLILPGGEIRGHTTAVMGGMTVSALSDFRFDLALLSCSAVDTQGCYELSLDSMLIKRTAIEKSKKSILIFDRTKANEHSPFLTTSLDSYDMLITDAEDGELEQLRAVHPKVLNE